MSEEGVLPVLPLRDYTVQPGGDVSLFVGRPASVAALQAALAGGKQLFAVTQKNGDKGASQLADLHSVGTVAEVQDSLRLPDGTLKVRVMGLRLARPVELVATTPYLRARIESVASSDDAAMGIRPPTPVRERADDIVETIDLAGFDPLGEPELRRERSGSFWLVFNFMPPSWVPSEEYSGFGRCANFDKELQAAIGSPVLWDDREFFLLEQPRADCIERINRFLAEFRARNQPAS